LVKFRQDAFQERPVREILVTVEVFMQFAPLAQT